MSREPLSRASRRSPTDVQREYVEHITDELLSGEAGFSHGVALLIALKIERDDARAEAAMAGAAEDGAMASANDLLERLDKAEAAREAWQADAERLYEALKREMEANDGKLLASTVWSGVLEDHEKLVRKLNE